METDTETVFFFEDVKVLGMPEQQLEFGAFCSQLAKQQFESLFFEVLRFRV